MTNFVEKINSTRGELDLGFSPELVLSETKPCFPVGKLSLRIIDEKIS
jgi:hypothetical protein